MAQIARNYHEELQTQGLLDRNHPERTNAEKHVLQQILDMQKFNTADSDLHDLITEDQTKTALLASKNGTATGLDGISYELWKTIHERHKKIHKQEENKNHKTPPFNVIKFLTIIYNNIQKLGTDPALKFSDRWMCPLYKKKDHTKIENYCPITLLNTDYRHRLCIPAISDLSILERYTPHSSQAALHVHRTT